MLAVVKRPRIEIRAKHIPAPLVRFLVDTYKSENVVVSDEDVSVPVEESEWFKSLETTPAEMIVANRDLRNWSQVTLAEKLGRGCSLPVYIMHIAVMCALLLFIPENVGFVSTYGALTAFAASAAIATLYNKIKSVIITVNRGKTEVVTT